MLTPMFFSYFASFCFFIIYSFFFQIKAIIVIHHKKFYFWLMITLVFDFLLFDVRLHKVCLSFQDLCFAYCFKKYIVGIQLF